LRFEAMTLRADRHRRLIRLLLSADIAIGLSVAFGMLLLAGAAHLLFGPLAAAAVSVGVDNAIPPDTPAPRRHKIWQLLPAAVIGAPLFYITQLVRADPLQLSALLVGMTFVAFLGAAWGKRGIPISMSIMFSMIFSLAEGAGAERGTASALSTSLYMAAGAFGYVVYATIANAVLNPRYPQRAPPVRRDRHLDGLFRGSHPLDADTPAFASPACRCLAAIVAIRVAGAL
jgi:hypothetical protein